MLVTHILIGLIGFALGWCALELVDYVQEKLE
jgi:hypothetical protein